jgi:hypothetical protein
MNYKIVRLTPNDAYHGKFFARLEFSGPNLETGVLDLTRARRWFDANFGAGCDLNRDTWGGAGEAYWAGTPPKWAWTSAWHHYLIYVQNGAMLGWFVLAHQRPVDQ